MESNLHIIPNANNVFEMVNSFFIDQEFCMGHRLLLYVKVNERKGELGYLFGTKHNGTIKLQL